MNDELEKLRVIAMKVASILRKAGHDREAADLSFQTGIVVGTYARERRPSVSEFVPRTTASEQSDDRSQ